MSKRRTVSALKGNPQNPRAITDEQLSMLGKSLAKFGDLGGIVFNRTTGQLVGGHQRAKVLPKDSEVLISELYDEPTPVGTVAIGYIRMDGELFSYREVEWDMDTEKAANIAANKHGGFFDLPKLREWVLDLDHKNFDMDFIGFTADDLDRLWEHREDQKPESKDSPEPKMKILECPHCEEQFELKQARVVRDV